MADSISDQILALMQGGTAGATDILTALQNAVQAINNLNSTIKTTFPQSASVTTSPIPTGTITFTSSRASGFYTTVSSSGATYKVALYT